MEASILLAGRRTSMMAEYPQKIHQRINIQTGTEDVRWRRGLSEEGQLCHGKTDSGTKEKSSASMLLKPYHHVNRFDGGCNRVVGNRVLGT